MTRSHLLLLAPAVLVLAACGSAAGPQTPTIRPARIYRLAGFTPSARVEPGKPVRISFTILQPSGRRLTAYRSGSGPHTGIHLILVRSDLATIIHRHPPVVADGKVSEEVVFPSAGSYRVVVDAYPASAASGPRNFQLFGRIQVGSGAKPEPLPPFASVTKVGGYRFVLHGRPRLRAIEPAFLTITVTNPRGRRARFSPWFGALAHAIFFRAGSLDYFHTHVCGTATSGCTSVLGPSRITGSSVRPGRLRVGVLLPVSGTWRLFLQSRADGHVLTAPFTLKVG